MQLNEKALLVSLVISQWSARKFDRKATDEVNKNHNATNAGRFNKSLIAQEHLKAIGKAVTAARQFHYDNTLPWGDNGERLLPSENYFEYTQNLSTHKNEFEKLVREFGREYPAMIEEARINLNGLFNEKEYPADVTSKFNIKAGFMPVPDVQDIRVNLSAAEVDTIKKQVQAEVTDRFKAAQADIYKRAADQLTYMHARLNEADAVFRDSLFNNVLDLVNLLPRLNIANDPNITAICEDLKSLYTDPEAVRKSKQLRADKAREAGAILNKFQGFFNA